MRRHRILVALCTLAALVGAVAYLSHRSPSYKATAEILVTPLASDDTTYQGLPFLKDFGEASRTIQTAAALIDSPAAATLTAAKLGAGWDRSRVDDTIEITPLGESTVLDVIAKANDAGLAAKEANAFAESTLEVRREVVKRQVTDALDRLRAEQQSISGNGSRAAAVDLARQISALERVQNGDDPTLSLSERAPVPTKSLGAPSWLIVMLALIAGLAVGAGVALLLDLGDRGVRDEFDVLSILNAPVFARSPVIRRRQQSATRMPPQIGEAFRTVRIRLERLGGGRRTILVTSATSGDGKTTSAINLSLSLIGAGHRVLLIDFDLRKPDVANQLGIAVGHGLAPMLTGTPLSDLVTAAPDMPLLRVIPAATSEADVVLLESLRQRMPAILAEARNLADFVVVDSAPLGEVADALSIAGEVDDILFVVRTGHTNRHNLEFARDLLGSIGREPTGLVIVGDHGAHTNSYYHYGSRPKRGRGSSSSEE